MGHDLLLSFGRAQRHDYEEVRWLQLLELARQQSLDQSIEHAVR
jgi:hypothetical protein